MKSPLKIHTFFWAFLLFGFTVSAQSTITVSKIVDCSLSETWKKWTTSDGICTFLGEDADIELQLQGKFEIHSSIHAIYSQNCKILSFLPNEMLSFTWKCPSKYRYLVGQHPIWVVVYFDAINDDMTRISIRQAGFNASNLWDDYKMEAKANWKKVLEQLSYACEK